MIPAVIEGHSQVLGAPQNWNEQKYGPCLGLPIRVSQQSGLRWMQSAWRPSPDELLALSRGACVILSISAPVHPVVSMGVGAVPGAGEDTGLTYARAGQTPNGHMMEVWDEERGHPLGRRVHEVNITEGWVKVYREGPMGDVAAREGDEDPQIDTLQGRFSIRWK